MAFGVLAVAPAVGDGIIDDDFPPIFAYSSWSALRNALIDSNVQHWLQLAVLERPLVAVSSKAASSGSDHRVCLRFHFERDGVTSGLRVYCGTGSSSGWEISQIRSAAGDPLPVRDAQGIASDPAAFSAFVAAIRDEALDAEVKKLLPQHGLRRIALLEASGEADGERRYCFAFEFVPVGRCGSSGATLVVEVTQDAAGATQSTALKSSGEGEGRG